MSTINESFRQSSEIAENILKQFDGVDYPVAFNALLLSFGWLLASVEDGDLRAAALKVIHDSMIKIGDELGGGLH